MNVSGRRRPVAVLLIAIAALLLLMGILDFASAQGSPFGGPRPPSAPFTAADGIAGWLLAKQAEFYRQFSGLIRAAKADGSAAWSLMGLSFLYGIFHAAGPGHGKAVISSYLVANEETWFRGVVLSLASALLQAVVAIAVVGIAAALLNLTAPRMNSAINVIETVSYALIVVIGVRLLWVKGRAFFATLHGMRHPASEASAVVTRHHDHPHHSGNHAHDRMVHSQCDPHEHHEHSHSHDDHGHDCASAWGHAHAPEPRELAGPGGWQRGLSAIVAVGLRPCSGAILILVFALAQGLFWIGVGSTLTMALGTFLTVAAIATIAVGAGAWAKHLATGHSGFGALAVRGVEVGAAMLITAFGILLLSGYMVNERMIGF